MQETDYTDEILYQSMANKISNLLIAFVETFIHQFQEKESPEGTAKYLLVNCQTVLDVHEHANLVRSRSEVRRSNYPKRCMIGNFGHVCSLDSGQ